MMSRPNTGVLTEASDRRSTIHNCMESALRDILLQCSGLAAIAVALIHGVLGETKVFARATIEPRRLRLLLRLVWQAGTVAWIGGGGVLFGPPPVGAGTAPPPDGPTPPRPVRLPPPSQP